jgi:hypothetical protein
MCKLCLAVAFLFAVVGGAILGAAPRYAALSTGAVSTGDRAFLN